MGPTMDRVSVGDGAGRGGRRVQDTLRGALAGSRDGVAMLLLLAMNHALQTRMARQGRAICCLSTRALVGP